jgi:hypothetical protein
MAKFDDGQDGVTSFDEILYNDIVRAIKNSITDSGQTIDATNTQLSKALANYAHISNFYTENGIANVYNLVSINSFKGLTALTNGAEVRFRAANANTGASTITVNGLGGGTAILQSDGVTPLSGSEISTDQDTRLRYSVSANAWILQSLITPAASQAEVDAGVVSDKYVAPNTLLGLFNASSQLTNGYIRIPINIGGAFNEIIIQWGFLNSVPSDGGTNVSFPIAFPNAVLNAQATQTGSSNDGAPNEPVHTRQISNSAMRVSNSDNSTNRNVYWFVLGY